MTDLLAGMSKQIAARLGRYKAARKVRKERKARLVDAMEQVVDGIDPRLRMVRGYARKLGPAVERALAHVDEACAKVPGPIAFNRRSWSTHPTVHALFATAGELRRVFGSNASVKTFLDQHRGLEVTHVYAVLGMVVERKTVLGVEQQGDIIRTDVPQVNVSFSDYRITHAAPDDQALRSNLRQRALHELVAQALRRVSSMKARREGLREQRVVLQMRLKALEGEAEGLTELVQHEKAAAEEMAEIRARMDSLEAACAEVKENVGTLDALLGQVASLLSRPEELIQVSPVTLRLDRMNRIVGQGPSARNDPIRLAEVTFGGDVKRVGILAQIPRDELIAAP